VEDVSYECTFGTEQVIGTFQTVESLSEFVDIEIAELDEKGIIGDPDVIKDAIRAAVARKRSTIEAFVAKEIEGKHDLVKVAQIHPSKIYPSNMEDVIPVGAKQHLDEVHFIQTQEKIPPPTLAEIAKDNADLMAALQNFKFKGSLHSVLYGRVRGEGDLFDGRTN